MVTLLGHTGLEPSGLRPALEDLPSLLPRDAWPVVGPDRDQRPAALDRRQGRSGGVKGFSAGGAGRAVTPPHRAHPAP
ncbi:hypothetical protein M0638_27565, partial [Roseomonas sp. NAR14]